jgi:hypothetical protein
MMDARRKRGPEEHRRALREEVASPRDPAAQEETHVPGSEVSRQGIRAHNSCDDSVGFRPTEGVRDHTEKAGDLGSGVASENFPNGEEQRPGNDEEETTTKKDSLQLDPDHLDTLQGFLMMIRP